MDLFQNLPSSVLQAGAIFLSIIIEALPFVLIGSIISGAIEVYVTPEKVVNVILAPYKRRYINVFRLFYRKCSHKCSHFAKPSILQFL